MNRREILRLILVAPVAAIIIPKPEPKPIPLKYLTDPNAWYIIDGERKLWMDYVYKDLMHKVVSYSGSHWTV